MESVGRKVKAESFVRQYSFKVAADLPENELAQFLMRNQSLEIARENKERDGIISEFNRWLCAESPDNESLGNEDLQLLFKERKELAETWLKFQTKYPEYGELLSGIRGPPNIEGLRSIMRNTAQDWENKRHIGFGRAKEKIAGFSESLMSFSDLFSIIPEGDKYFSLFTGVISTTIKAASRHKEIAEGFCTALEEIGKEMSFSTRELKIHRTKNMERLVIRLYIRHAKFFCHFMTWYLSSSSRRFGTSLRNDFYTEEVRHRVTEIQSVVKEIEREASLNTQISTQQILAEVRIIGSAIDEFMRMRSDQHNLNVVMEALDRQSGLIVQLVGQHSRNYMVGHCDNLLYDAAVAKSIKSTVSRDELVNHCVDGSQPSRSPSDLHKISDVQYSQIPTLLPRVFLFTRSSLQQLSQRLQPYYPFTNPDSEGNIHATRDLAARTVSGMVVIKLKEWLASPRSDLLWILGSNSPFGNEASLAASHILDIAVLARLPCVSFSCNSITAAPEIRTACKTRCVTLLISLLYSIIHQLLSLGPETFEDAYNLENSIQTMEGGEDSIPKALETIQALMRHRTPLLLVILDRLELVEDKHTVPYLRNLIGIFHLRQTDSRLKVLLGSQGFLASGGDLGLEERIDCTLLPRRRPGRAQPGGRSLGELNSFPL